MNFVQKRVKWSWNILLNIVDEAFKGKELERKITSKFYQQLVKIFQQADLADLINSHHPV